MSLSRAFGILLGPPALLCCACTLQAEAPTAQSPAVNCTVHGKEHAGASVAEICESFTQALEQTGAAMGVDIEISVLSPRAARAIARDSDGAVLLERDFDVMDAEIRPALWRDFAGQFARALNAVHSN